MARATLRGLEAMILCGAAFAAPLSAQSAIHLRAGVSDSDRTHPAPISRPYAPLASLVLPGGGQYLLGDNRFVAYGAVEVVSWFLYGKDRQDQRRQEALFKDLARQVARAHFSATFPDAPWAYYEQMRDWLESGAYSQSATTLVPETDTLTYNGYKWQLALRTNETRAAALDQYEQVAVKPDFQWSWRNAQEQWDVYKRNTDSRNDANRAAIRELSIIAANHILSMVDAFATIRLSVQATADGRTAVGASLRW